MKYIPTLDNLPNGIGTQYIQYTYPEVTQVWVLNEDIGSNEKEKAERKIGLGIASGWRSSSLKMAMALFPGTKGISNEKRHCALCAVYYYT